jgi:hypothetical protein
MSASTRSLRITGRTALGLAELVSSLEELLITRQQLVRALRHAHGVPLTNAADAPRMPTVILEAELVALTARQERLLARLVAVLPPE